MICDKCIFWVTADMQTGFCLCRDLFTQTHEDTCDDYSQGQPCTEEEWEEAQGKK